MNMKKNLPSILIIIFTILVVAGLVIFSSKTTTSTKDISQLVNPVAKAPKVGDTEIDFSLKNLDGKLVKLSSYKDKEPVLIEFFAAWCPHCQASIPTLNDLNTTYNNKLQILSVQANPYDVNREKEIDLNGLKEFRDSFKITYPVLQDPTIDTANKYGVSEYPYLFIIDKSGKVSYVTSGEIDSASATAEIKSAIDKVI